MRVHRSVLTFAFAIAAGVAIQSPAFSDDYRGTWEQQMACTPDVMRLCGDQIPDVSRIVACLRQNTSMLGNSCRAVFESNASAQLQPAPRLQQQTVPRPRVTQPAPSDDDDQ